MHRKAEEEAEGFSSDNGMWVRRSFDEEKLSSTTIIFFLSFPAFSFSPSPDIVRHGGMVMVEEITPPPPHYSRRDPLFTRENLLLESPVGLSSCSACISRANLAG